MLSLIVPVYRNEEGLDDLLAAVAQLAANELHGFECVFVVDGSPDRCYEKLRARLRESFLQTADWMRNTPG